MASHTIVRSEAYASATAEPFPALAPSLLQRFSVLVNAALDQASRHLQLSWQMYLRNLFGVCATSAAAFAVWVLVIRQLG